MSSLSITGFVEYVDTRGLHGWATNTASAHTPLRLIATFDKSIEVPFVCDHERRDVLSAGHQNAFVGFTIQFPDEIQDGRPHVCDLRSEDGSEITIRQTFGNEINTCCFICGSTLQKPSDEHSRTYGFVEQISEKGVIGWAIDPDSDLNARILVYIDNIFFKEVTCDLFRADVSATQIRGEVGFDFKLSSRCYDEQPHTLQFLDQKHLPIRLGRPNADMENLWTFKFQRYAVEGRIDGFIQGRINGWVFLVDNFMGTSQTRNKLIVRWQKTIVAEIVANDPRADVAEAFGCDIHCGFSFSPTPEMTVRGASEFSFYVLPVGVEIHGSPIWIDFLSEPNIQGLHKLASTIDELFRSFWNLKQDVSRLIPVPPFNLDRYDEWARRYFREMNSFQGLMTKSMRSGPLISVLCPVFKPRVTDFRAAVESVRSQSYENWELILVDDASNDSALTALMREFCGADRRIKVVEHHVNQGISESTNSAISLAQGQYIALFDHDDLIEPIALEVMVFYAQNTGAELLYSDEDKIDDFGIYSEPNFKPAWNYRLLLSQNYICHLALIERNALRRAGLFRTACDGAQDHDIFLRLSEVIDPHKIYHVPHVLYHWRKTPQSTAASGGAKTYTVNAGLKALEDHLIRVGRPRQVSQILQSTIYKINMQTVQPQKKVTIVIPYRDHAEITEKCLISLFKNTNYKNFEVILIDNWSTSDSSLRFKERWSIHEKVRFIYAPEKFNYSKLNNDAVKQSDAELIVFMNNDIVLVEPHWLDVMVGEIDLDPTVGAVGAKLLYPSGFVQHGGVILGVGGIADHAHRMLNAQEPGYSARASCAQQMSAVTAALMLCKRDILDRVGGFDDKELLVAYNDVDLCLKINRAGGKVIWTPFALAEHHESISRGSDLAIAQQTRFFHEHHTMLHRWENIIEDDPFYNIHFSRRSGMFRDLGEPAFRVRAAAIKSI